MSGRNSGMLTRRAFVTVHIARLRGNGFRAAQAHLRYIERDGVDRNGNRSRVYSAAEDRPSGRDFLDRCSGDRHYFRITASAEDGAQYDDLKPLVRRFMARMEDDLGTSLEWVAADHADTLYPHTHLIVRGRDDHGEGLVIAPAYMNDGMSRRLAGIVSIDLGPRTEDEAALRLRLEVEAECVTSLDRKLLNAADPSGVVVVGSDSMAEQSLLTGRLHKLRALGLAEPLGGLRWKVDGGLEEALDSLAERRESARTLRRELMVAGVDRPLADQVVHEAGAALDLVGQVIGSGLAGDAHERRFVIIDAADGRSHFVDLGTRSTPDLPLRGATVRLQVVTDAATDADLPRVSVELLSAMPIEQLAAHEGASWLDRQLVSPSVVARDAGFGRDLRSALERRRMWLAEEGLATVSERKLTYRSDMLQLLERRELVQTAAMLEAETGLVFVPAEEGSEFEGIVRRRLELASGRYAMIESAHEFALVPWTPVHDRAVGAPARATASVDALTWSPGRERDLEI